MKHSKWYWHGFRSGLCLWCHWQRIKLWKVALSDGEFCPYCQSRLETLKEMEKP